VNIAKQIISVVGQSESETLKIITPISEIVQGHTSRLTSTSVSPDPGKKGQSISPNRSRSPPARKTPVPKTRHSEIIIDKNEILIIFDINKIETEGRFSELKESTDDAFITLLELICLLKGVDIEADERYKKIPEYLYEICHELREQKSELRNSLKKNERIKNRMLEIFKYITIENNFLGPILKDYTCLLYLLIYGEGILILPFYLFIFIYICVLCLYIICLLLLLFIYLLLL
jgi:hypothetical protein